MRASDRLRLLGPSEHGSLRSAPQKYGGRGGEPGGVWSAAGALLGRSKQWYRERRKMDLEIEQSPLESKFSAQLQDLMGQEEQICAMGPDYVQGRAAQQAAATFAKVDELLAVETKRYFETQSRYNQQRWQSLFRRHAQEQARFHEELDARMRAVATHVGAAADAAAPEPADGRDDASWAWPSASSPTAAQQAAARPAPGGDDADADRRFDEAERRMRAATAAAWREHELFNLSCAFGLQLARVDAEWAAYESRLKQEVDARLGALDARRTDAAVAEPADAGGPRQWRDKEKQSRLVHTAPVFEPDAQQDGAMPKIAVSGRDEGGDKRLFSNGSRQRATSPAKGTRPGAPARPAAAPSVADDAERQVAELRQGYAKALDRVEFQKANAKKWIHRQKTRMTIQIDACDPVCRFLASRVAAATESDGAKARQASSFDARIKTHLGATRGASEAAAAQAAPQAAAPRSAAAPGLGPGLPLQNHAAFPAHDAPGRRRPPTSDAVVRGGGRTQRNPHHLQQLSKSFGGSFPASGAAANPYAKAGGRRPNTSGAPSRGRVRGGFSPIHNAGARKGVDASGLGEASMKATPLRMHVRAG